MATPDQTAAPQRLGPEFVQADLRGRAGRIAAGYAAFAMLWIFFSDRALTTLVDDPVHLLQWSVYKGLAFVVVTSVLLFFLIRRAFRTIEAGYASLKQKEEQRRVLQAEAERLGRLYAALSQVNQAIVRMPSREELFEKVCQALGDFGRFRMVWIGWHDEETERILPVARWGDDEGYLETIEVYADDRPMGRGPSGIAFRSGQPYICNDIFSDVSTVPWRLEADRRDYRSSGAFPIRLRGEIRGLLNVYAEELDFFQTREIELLEETAADVSFALDNLERDEARREAEAAARSEKLFSETIIESMPGILYLYTREGKFLRWNRNFEEVSGCSAAEIEQAHPLDFFAAEDREELAARIAEVFDSGESSVELPFVSRDGTATPHLFTGRRVSFEGRDCLVGVGIDISELARAEAERRRAEEALRRLNQTLELKVARRTDELQAALTRAEAADRLKSAFLATMSHELRTPLNSIIGFTGTVLQGLAGPLTKEQTKQLDMVRSSAKHLLELITDVLDLSKIEAGQLTLRSEPVDVEALVAQVVESVRPQAESRGIALYVNVEPDVAPVVSDRRRMGQVLLNLLSNGIKFTDEGSVTLTVERADGHVRLRVADTGIGIRPEELELLFQPFRQLDDGLTRQREGTGLGLAICRRMTTLMGGEITVTSEWQRGSEFCVTLPAGSAA